MIKQALVELGLESFAVVGLVLFVGVFLGAVAWALSRTRRQVDRWATLPLTEGAEPVEPRDGVAADRADDPHGSGGCGNCLSCACESPTLTTITTFTTNAAR